MKCLHILLFFTVLGSVAMKPLNGASSVKGKVQAHNKCDQGEVELFVSDGSTLIYQASNWVGGSFEFHLMPGEYEMTAIDRKGCFFGEKFKLKSDSTKQLLASLQPPKEPKK